MTLLLNPIFSLNDGGIYWIFASVIEVYPNDGHYFAKYQGILGELIVLKFQRI
ncbi:hypothetical protein EV693_102105 [Nicoletella semolina]|uniref:Uncharacterized protein n=1 Tax=Nicoletella semolina TaxID=271160 RepID=A0A4V2SKB9_9PAST|nr:hypothetical protein EV693_102105 [Nicoletella semolina]